MRSSIRYIVYLAWGLMISGLAGAQEYQVGDVYYGETGEKEGVVFWVNPERTGGWVVALKNLDWMYDWGPYDAEVPVPAFDSGLEAMKDLNGYENTRKLREYWGGAGDYAAQNVDFDNGWYLPSAGQLRKLLSVLGVVDSVLSENGGNLLYPGDTHLASCYWSSTPFNSKDVFMLRISRSLSGLLLESKKVDGSHKFITRPIRDFVMIPKRKSVCSYHWNTGASDPQLTTQPRPGKNDYSLTVTSCRGGCSAEARQTVLVATPGDITYEDTICRGEVYRKNGFDTYDPGWHEKTQDLTEGCSILLKLNLTVANTFRMTFTDRFCRGSVYSGYNFTAYQPGVYEQRWTTREGCDSIVTLVLEEAPSFDVTYSDQVCAGNEYEGYGFRILSVKQDTLCIRNSHTPEGCDSLVRLFLTVPPPAYQEYYDSVCGGESYTGYEHFSLPVVTQDTVCEYRTTSVSGCDSMIYLHLKLRQRPVRYVEDRICEGEVYTKYGLQATEEGTYEGRIPAVTGCDTVLYVSLQVNPLRTVLLDDSVCPGGAYKGFGIFDFPVVTRDTVCEYRTTSVSGCDSTIYLHLKLRQRPVKYVEDRICEGEVYTKYGLQATEKGTYEGRLSAETGCDTVLYVSLQVHASETALLSDSVCIGSTYSGYEVFDFPAVTQDTIAKAVLVSREGCDSTVLLRLKCLPLPEKNVEGRIKQGESYTDYGLHLTEEKIYVIRWPAQTGCDSLIKINLKVEKNYEKRIDTAICEGQHYTEYSWNLTSSQRDTLKIVTNTGPDTVVYLNLQVNPVYELSVNDSFCEREIYAKYGLNVTESGLYPVMLRTVAGCDSLLLLHLTCHPVYQARIDTSICEGEVFDGYGIRDSVAGTKIIRYKTLYGCDSLLEVRLDVHPSYVFTEKRFLCEGDSCVFFGNAYRKTGNYIYRLSTLQGCDSMYRLELTVHSAGQSVIDTSICRGERFQGHGFDTDQEGESIYKGQTLYGCDSTVFLHLKVIDFFEGNIGFFTEDCETHTYRFEAEGRGPEQNGRPSFVWDFGDGTEAEGEVARHSYRDSGRYEVRLTAITGGKCRRTLYLPCRVPYYAQEITFYPDVEVIDADYPEVIFQADSLEGMRYFWDFGDGTSVEGKERMTHRYEVKEKDFYEVRLQVKNEEDCVAETSLRLKVCLFPDIPNTFSPNGDGINDVFMKGYRVEIRNRDGVEVYQGMEGWDGTYRGKQVEEDVYFYSLFYKTARGERHKKGFVNVVR